MKLKRILSALTAAALAAALTLPIGAAGSSFSDISDQNTAVNADILRLMGVVSGSGGNRFDPNGILTRAQFCTMVVNFMGLEDSVVLHSTRTIFSDVTASHWARGYVNLAASTNVGDKEKSSPLISGVGDGRFEPDASITFAQAVTILIRVLNYTGDQVGAVWPQGYLNLAQSIGLTDGVSLSPNDAITRAQAAQLFVNALDCKTGGGAVYYTSLTGTTVKEDVILLAVNAKTDDGSQEGAIRTSDGSYLPHADNVIPSALAGQRGALVLNDRNEIVTFVPDDTTSVTVVLSGGAQAAYVTASNGTRYTIPSATPVYTADKADSSPYSTAFTQLYSGNQVTLFTDRGKVVALYSGSGTATTTDAVVVTGGANTATFHQLTGGITDFAIQKNRQSIRMSDIKPYDVVTYDSISNTLIVSDLRLTCVYEDASPNFKAPETITVLGHEFPVLESAWDTVGNFSIGSNVALLLTADGKVAGMAEASSKTRSTAIGLAGSGSVEVFLPNGGTLTLSGDVPSSVRDQLVTVSSTGKGKMSAGRLGSQGSSGDFNLDSMTLGKTTVAAGVRVFEQVNGGGVVPISLATLDTGVISGEKIASYHLNSSGMADFIVLEQVTGDAYIYGMMVVTSITEREMVLKPDGSPVYNNGEPVYQDKITRSLSLVNGTKGTISLPNAGYAGRSGTYVGIALDSKNLIKGILDLTEIKNVSPSDFFESQGHTYVTVKGKTYRVADNVECYHGTERNQFTPENWYRQADGSDRLNSCLASSSNLTLYIDPVGNKVRIVTAD